MLRTRIISDMCSLAIWMFPRMASGTSLSAAMTVNAVNQDILGHQAHQDVVEDGLQIWSRDLYDGSYAVGIFNLNEASVPVRLDGALGKIGLQAGTVRDLWRQKDISTNTEYVIPPHGVLYVKVQ